MALREHAGPITPRDRAISLMDIDGSGTRESAASTGRGAREKGLRKGAVGLISGVVIGMASTAPAYSLAASLALVTVTSGVKAPSIMLVAFVPVFLIALAYRQLNRRDPDCGTAFTWAARAFGPWVGWMGGWAVIAANVICISSVAQIAGAYTLRLLGADPEASPIGTTAVGVVWIVVMTFVSTRGIKIAARLQYVLLGVELTVLAAFSVVALVRVYGGDAAPGAVAPSLAWLSPAGLDLSDIVDGVLIAIFLYWGWDTAVACNEESEDPGRNPGRAALLSSSLLVITYVLVTVAAVAFAGAGSEGVGLGNPDNADDAFAAISPAIFGDSAVGHFFLTLLVLSVLTSSVACTQTTILPASRSVLAMARRRALPEGLGTVDERFQTPVTATWAVGIAATLFYVGLTALSRDVLADAIAALGLLVSFYYGLTGFACVQLNRGALRGRALWVKGVLPGLGGLLLFGTFVLSAWRYAAPDAGETTLFGVGGVVVIGVGALAVGGAIMAAWSRRMPEYFRRPPGAGGVPDPDVAAAEVRVR